MRLKLLLFSVGGVHFGVDAEQVSEMRAFGGEREEDLFWFHEALPGCEVPARYASPTVISIRAGEGRPYRVIIDLMEDIGCYGPDDIRLFPALVEPFALRCGMWGILPRDGKLAFLVDFQRLLAGKRTDCSIGKGEPGVSPS